MGQARRRQLVHVIWADSASHRGWVDETDIDAAPCTVESVGWILRRNREGLTLCAHYSTTDQRHSPMTIPRGAIKRIEYLKEPRRRAD